MSTDSFVLNIVYIVLGMSVITIIGIVGIGASRLFTDRNSRAVFIKNALGFLVTVAASWAMGKLVITFFK